MLLLVLCVMSVFYACCKKNGHLRSNYKLNLNLLKCKLGTDLYFWTTCVSASLVCVIAMSETGLFQQGGHPNCNELFIPSLSLSPQPWVCLMMLILDGAGEHPGLSPTGLWVVHH